MFERLETRRLMSAVDVLTQHNDLNRSGENLSETVLNTSNVNSSTFGRLYTRPVDDQVYAQPLVATNISIAGGTHNVLFVATVNDSIYAFDATDPTVVAPYWKDSLFSTANGAAAGARPVFHTDVGQNCGTYSDFSGNVGIVGTPVIDKASNTIYMVARTIENGAFVQRLHALDLSNGSEKFGGPVVIAASVPGTGDGAVNGVVSFSPQTENQRDGLALANGQVIIGWASHCDTGPYHGWLMGYDASTLKQSWRFNTTPNGSEGGIWMSGAAPAVDSSGNIYVTSGNGSVSVAGKSYGEGILKISPAGVLLDYFIPSNWQSMNNIDADFGSSGVLIVPGSNTLITGDKEGKFFVADKNNLTGLNSTDQILQEFQVTPNVNNDHIHGAPVYYKDSSNNQWIYVWGMGDKLKQFQFNSGTGKLNSTTATHTSNVSIAPTPSQPGGLLSVSGNGNVAGTGIVWSMSTLGPSANQMTQPGILRAFDASNVSVELWNSQQNASRDDFGNLAKFSDATITDGRVYVPTFSNQVAVYGLLANRPAAPASLTATPVVGAAEIDLSWPAVAGAADYSIERSVGTGIYTPLVTVVGNTLSYNDTAVVSGATYHYRLRARNGVGESDPVSTTAATFFQQQLVARWKFDDATSGSGGTAADSSGNGNTGTVGSGASWSTAGKLADALSFTSGAGSANSLVTVPSSATLNPRAQISVTTWVNATDWTGNHRIVQKGVTDNQYRLLVENGKLKFDLFGIGVVNLSSLPSTGTWHNIAATYDTTTIRLYVDGVQVASAAGTKGATIATSSDPLIIGSKSAGGSATDHMNGKLDDVRIYNYALSATDVSALFANTVPSAPTALTLTPSSPSMVNMSWTDTSSNESGFILQRKTGAAGTYATIATISANTTSYIDSNLSAGTTYFYRIASYNAVDSSAYSAEKQTTTASTSINQLVAQYKFDETSTSVATDSSGLNNNGAFAGSPAHSSDSPDHSASSLSFNGTTQFVSVPDSFYLQPTSTITLATWIKSSDWSGTRGLIAKGDREGAYYILADSGVLNFNLSNQGTLTAPLPSLNVWHSIVGTYDGTTMRIFIDGVQVATKAATGPLSTSNDPLFIGGTGASAATGQAFAGLMDDARIYNYAILPTDVSAIYGNVSQWKFIEGSGTTAADATPFKNTLTLVNSPTWIAGVGSSSLQFNGTNQYAFALDKQSLNPTAAISLMAFVNAASWTGTPRIIQKGSTTTQYSLIGSNGQIQFILPNVGTLVAAAPTVGSWHHIAGTYNGATMNIYIDGVLAATKSATGAIASTTDDLYIGSAGTANTAGTIFNGSVDDVRVFSRAITAGEVQEISSAFLNLAGTHYLKLDADGVTLNVFNNSAGTGTATKYLLANIGLITDTGAAAASSLTIDNSAGEIVPSGGINVVGGAGAMALKIIGTPGDDAFNISASSIAMDQDTIRYSSLASIAITTGTGIDSLTQSAQPGNGASLTLTDPTANDSITIKSGVYTFPSPTGSGITTVNLGVMTIAVGAQIVLSLTAVQSNHQVFNLAGLNVSGNLDLGNTDVLVQAGSLAAIENYVTSGTRITSSAVTNDPQHITTIGVLQNNQTGTPIYSAGKLFDGVIAPGASDVLIKYAYFGDVNLDGAVDGTDYSAIDFGFLAHATGWINGDFNRDGVVDGSDYSLIDNAFNQQTATPLAVPTTMIAKSTAEVVPSFRQNLFGETSIKDKAAKSIRIVEAIGLANS